VTSLRLRLAARLHRAGRFRLAARPHRPGRGTRAAGAAALALAAGLPLVTAAPATARATAPAGTTTAGLTINVSQDLGRISPGLFGSNVAWNAESDFMRPGTDQYYPKFLRQVAAVRYGSLRFPGGSLGTYYDWQNAIGPLPHRTPGTFFDDGPEPSLLGPDEFGRLLRVAGADGDVIINPNEPAAEAADFVAYMTLPAPREPVADPASPEYWAGLRARYGHPAPYHVTWWEVGNEVNTAGNAGWLVNVPGSVVSYANPHCASSNVRACLYVFGGTTRFTDQPAGTPGDFQAAASLSTGAAGQVKYVAHPPVVPQDTTVYVGGQPWTRLDSFAGQGPAATVYRLDPASGQITFGDGVHGAIPSAGSAITASYDSGPHPGFADFYRAMKAVNPAVHVCLGASAYGNIGPFLQDLGSSQPYDCVPTHPYVRDGTSLAQGEIPNSLPEADYDTQILALPGALAGQVTAIRQDIDQYAGGNASRVTIPVTEFGQLRSSVPGFAPDFHLSLQEGILVAGELRQWVKLGLPLAEHYLLEGSPFGSTAPHGNTNVNSEIVGPGPRTIAEPTALVEQLFRPLGGQHQAAVQPEAVPTVSLPDGSQLPALETLASRGGDHVSLLVINQSGGSTVPATIRVSQGELRLGTLTTLDAASALSYNTPGDPTAVWLHRETLPAGPGAPTLTFPAHSVSLLQATLTAAP
jgi:alpha-N-arabinofuranosidase